MIDIHAQSASSIEQWTLAESGLPARIVNACHTAAIQTVGELCRTSPSRLLNLPHFGRRSLERCHLFHECCDELSSGTLQIRSLRQWMETFISPDGYEVISSRYGFFRADPGAGRKFFTLQDIANRTGRSRERIRQVEETSSAMLSRKLPRAGLYAAALKVAAWLETQDDSADWAALQTLSGWEEWDGASPASMAFYLGERFPNVLSVRDGYVSRIPFEELEAYRSAALSRIQSLKTPMSLANLTDMFHNDFPETSTARLQKFLELELQQASDLICTVNRTCCGSRPLCLIYLLRDQLRGQDQPIHFRELTRRVNLQLAPTQAAGAGTILRCLRNGHFKRLDFGLYLMSPSS